MTTPKGWNRECGQHKVRRYAGPVVRSVLLKRYNYHCGYCGAKITNETANIDHIVPWIKGGTTRPKNLVPVCGDCNKRKGNRIVFEFIEPALVHNPKLRHRIVGIERRYGKRRLSRREWALIREADQLTAWL